MGRFISCALTILMTLSVASAEEPPADLSTLAASFDAARVGGRVGPLPLLKVGRGEIRPADPNAVFALVAEGRVCGVLVPGAAAFSYLVEDRFSLPLAQHNLKALGVGLEVKSRPNPPVIEEKLDGAAIWGTDLVPSGTVPGTPDPSQQVPQWLSSTLERRLDGNPGRDLALSVANGEPGYRWALLHRGGDDLVLDVDPRPSVRLESLQQMWNLHATAGPYSGKWTTETIVAQPIGRNWWEPTTYSVAVVDTEIAATNPQGEMLQATIRSKLQAQVDGLRLLAFDLLSGIYDSREIYRSYRVTRVTLDGEPAPFVHGRHTLLVARPQPLKKNETTLLEVQTEGEILDRPDGANYWWLIGEAWYPHPQGGFEWSEIRVTADAAAPFVPFSAGEVVRREPTATGERVTTRLPKPMQRATVMAGKYRTFTEEQGGSRIHVSTYATPLEEEARKVARLIFAVRAAGERWLGVPYPFQDLQVIEISSWGWGMAPAGMIFITREAFMTRARAAADEDTQWIAGVVSRGVNERIAHEVAHGWFPHVAKVFRTEENWLSESLAEYVSAYCLQAATADAKLGRKMFDRQLREWQNMDREIKEGGSIYLANYLPSHGSQYLNRQYLLYGRGPLVIHAIRQELRKQKGEEEGDRLFLTWIRSYVKSFTYKVGETRHLIAILDQITGQSWQPFFERYVYGPESPKVK